jgi:hypothetical protein
MYIDIYITHIYIRIHLFSAPKNMRKLSSTEMAFHGKTKATSRQHFLYHNAD